MSKHATVVIGAGYGDEGKGLMTDYFAANSKDHPVVIRYNGGAQAGHTVATQSGARHVFMHHGAGTIVGAPTYLARDFIFNPFLLHQERLTLTRAGLYRGGSPFVHPKCRVTTPYDMLLNQTLENARDVRHGSCGVGIFATMQRDVVAPLRIETLSKMTLSEVRDMLLTVRDLSLNTLKSTGIPTGQDTAELFDLDYSQKFYETSREELSHYRIATYADLSDMTDHFIFEGAQGLLLSEKYGDFPHCTPSDPGLTSPVEIADLLGCNTIEAVYTTRAYATRHGNGPLTGETTAANLGLKNIESETNQQNDMQGMFRYAPLDVARIKAAVESDSMALTKSSRFTETVISLAVTCLDQVPDRSIVGTLTGAISAEIVYTSTGPTRHNVQVMMW